MQIDGLIVNCTAFNPTPSLSAAVVRHFKFKSSIRTVNLSGMGCAASVIAVDIARDMLKVPSLGLASLLEPVAITRGFPCHCLQSNKPAYFRLCLSCTKGLTLSSALM